MKRLTMTAATIALTAGSAFAAAHTGAMIDTETTMTDGSKTTFAKVVASSDGYLVIHDTDADGNVIAPASIGHVAVKKGDNMDVSVTTDTPLEAGKTYVAMLHDETNGNEMYEFAAGMTEVDTPTMMDDKAVVAQFEVAAMMDTMESTDAMESTETMKMDMMPMAIVDGVSFDGDTVTIPSVTAAEDGYIVIHTILDGAPVIPASIGHTAIKAGENKDVMVKIDYNFVPGETYMAMLHTETNGNDTYDFGEGMTDADGPVMVEGEIAASIFAR